MQADATNNAERYGDEREERWYCHLAEFYDVATSTSYPDFAPLTPR